MIETYTVVILGESEIKKVLAQHFDVPACDVRLETDIDPQYGTKTIYCEIKGRDGFNFGEIENERKS